MSEDKAKLRSYYDQRYRSLENERNSFLGHWNEIDRYIMPRTARISDAPDQSKGRKKDAAILDSTARLAVRTFTSGMMAGFASPTRPWFRLSTSDPDLADHGSVKEWLWHVQQVLYEVFNRSNFYQILPQEFRKLGLYGTGCMSIEEDFKQAIRCYSFPVGSFMIALDHSWRSDTLYRLFPMTASQLIKQFGMDQVSPTAQSLYKSNQHEYPIQVVHACEPNLDRDTGKLDAKEKPWRSVYYEYGQTQELFLRESGFDEFPFLAPRWDTLGEDVYGYSPGMDALADVKALQKEQAAKLRAIETKVKPPMLGDSTLRATGASFIPGGITWIDNLAAQQHAGLRPVYSADSFSIKEVLQDIQETQNRINKVFFVDLMQMLTDGNANSDMTAREVEERHQEKVFVLGPQYERLNDELFDPAIDRTFAIVSRKGMIPPAPPELHGQPLKVEYTSIMAQAMKLVGVPSLERVIGFVSNIGQFAPGAFDKLDTDEAIDQYADMYGVAPKIIRDIEKVMELRKKREAQQKMQAMAQMADPAMKMGKAAQSLSNSDVEGVNALTKLMGAS